VTTGRAHAVALISGAALTLAFPEPDAAPIAWVALAPLLALAHGAGARRGAALGFSFGVGFFGVLLLWQSLVGWVAYFLLVAVEIPFAVLFGAAWGFASRRGGLVTAVVVPAAMWVAVEALRALVPLGGFTWGQLVQSQHNLGWLLRPAALGGGWLVSFLVAAVNALVAQAWLTRASSRRDIHPDTQRPRRTVATRDSAPGNDLENTGAGHVPSRLSGALLAAAAALLALPALLPVPVARGPSARVGIVQGNVERDPENFPTEIERELLASHTKLTEELASQRPDLVIWPENAVAIDPFEVPAVGDAVARAARAVDAPMLVGGELDIDEARRRVALLHVTPQGDIPDYYQKRHHVPFGEYVPARRWLDWIPLLDQIPRDAVRGPGPKVFDLAGGKVSPVISFEGDFGPLVRQGINEGGRLLVVATNNSTYGHTWNSAQHVAFSQVRAVENGVWVVHAALTGVSAFISPDGAVVDSSPMWTATSLVRDVRFSESTTFYTRAGEWVPVTCGVVALASLMLAFARDRSTVKRSPRGSREVSKGAVRGAR
jgi:apolipoprotein N-acyltransferase